MSKKRHKDKRSEKAPKGTILLEDVQQKESAVLREDYDAQLRMIQIELVKLQRHFIGCGDSLMRDILSRLHYAGRKKKRVQADRRIAFEFTPDCIRSQRLAR